jgi:dolichol-phosphate mannosyltransferase
MTGWVGFRQTGVKYKRDARHAGETNYPFGKMVRLALDAITGFSYFPLQIMIYVSLVLGTLALLGIPIVSGLRLIFGNEFFGGQATTIVALLLLSSFQLFFLFVMGQYVARIYDEARGRPLYVVASTDNLEPAANANAVVVPEMAVITHQENQENDSEAHGSPAEEAKSELEVEAEAQEIQGD